jgi:hypothetical protein
MTEARKPTNPVRGLICGAFVSFVLSAMVGTFVSIAWGISQRGIGLIIPGAIFWMAVWALGGTLIASVGEQRNNSITIGAICGAIVGAATGIILIVWPYCSQPTNPVPQDFVLSLGMPMLLAHDVIFGILKLPEGWIGHLSFSILFWVVFGVLLAGLIKKTNHRQSGSDTQAPVTNRLSGEAPTSSS